jgi:hypothetical protein
MKVGFRDVQVAYRMSEMKAKCAMHMMHEDNATLKERLGKV